MKLLCFAFHDDSWWHPKFSHAWGYEAFTILLLEDLSYATQQGPNHLSDVQHFCFDCLRCCNCPVASKLWPCMLSVFFRCSLQHVVFQLH